MIPSEHARQLITRIRSFIDEELLPLEAAHNINFESDIPIEIYREVWRRSAAHGFYQLMIPPEFGGAGLSTSDLCAIKESIAASPAVLFLHVLGEYSGPPRIGHLFKSANRHQLEQFLMPVARSEKAICFALTEAEAGSDAASMQTRASRDGGDYVLTGTKKFITGAPFADLALVFARTESEKGAAGISLFFVDLKSPGVRVECDYLPTSGQRSHGNILLDRCRVPEINRVGAEGEGFRLGMSRITLNRLTHCPTMIGLAQRAYDVAIARACNRSQFGQSIASFQAIQHMLADMETGLYACRSMVYRAAMSYDSGKDIRREASICKLFCSETTFAVADKAIQIQGGVGLIKGNPAEWVYRMLRMFRIVTGTSEIQRNTIARSVIEEFTRAHPQGLPGSEAT